MKAASAEVHRPCRDTYSVSRSRVPWADRTGWSSNSGCGRRAEVSDRRQHEYLPPPTEGAPAMRVTLPARLASAAAVAALAAGSVLLSAGAASAGKPQPKPKIEA